MIVLSPWPRRMMNGKLNPKSPSVDWWKKLVNELVIKGKNPLQIGLSGDDVICSNTKFDMSYKELRNFVADERNLIVTVDSFIQHLCWDVGRSCLVIWGPSNPAIYGHKEHNNIYLSEKNFAENQFDIWERYEHTDSIFPSPVGVADLINRLS